MQTVPTINEPYALSVSRPLGVCVLRVRACRSVNSRLGDKVSTTEECIACIAGHRDTFVHFEVNGGTN